MASSGRLSMASMTTTSIIAQFQAENKTNSSSPFTLITHYLIARSDTLSMDIPAKTNEPTQEMKPDRKELKGKVPTRQQYKN